MRTLKVHSVSNFQIWNTILLIIVSLLYINTSLIFNEFMISLSSAFIYSLFPMSSNIFNIFYLEKTSLDPAINSSKRGTNFSKPYTYPLPLFTCHLIIHRAFGTPLPSNWNVSIIYNISNDLLLFDSFVGLLWLAIFLKLSLQNILLS